MSVLVCGHWSVECLPLGIQTDHGICFTYIMNIYLLLIFYTSEDSVEQKDYQGNKKYDAHNHVQCLVARAL